MPPNIEKQGQWPSINHSLLSPSGKVSKKHEKKAKEDVRKMLFGDNGLQIPLPDQPSEAQALLNQAKELRELAKRGMKPKAYIKKAKELEARAGEARESK